MSGLLQAFVDGFINPLTTPAHVLVLLALALLMAREPQRFVVLLVFALTLVAGFVAIVLAVETTPARTVLQSRPRSVRWSRRPGRQSCWPGSSPPSQVQRLRSIHRRRR